MECNISERVCIMTAIQGHAGLMFNQYSAESKALFAAMDEQPDGRQKNGIDAAITALVDGGYWARMDALIVPKLANAQQSACVDWKRLTVATINGSATWVQANGFVGSTTAGSYINTLFTPSTDAVAYAQDSASMGVIVDTVYADANSRYYFGSNGPNGNFIALNAFDTGTIIHVNTTGSSGDADLVVPGLIVVQRSGPLYQNIFINGVLMSNSLSASGGLPNAPVYLLARNNNNTVTGTLPAKVAMWYAGDEFTGGEQDAINAIFNTYFAAVA